MLNINIQLHFHKQAAYNLVGNLCTVRQYRLEEHTKENFQWQLCPWHVTDFNKTTYSLIRFLFSKIKLVLTYSNKVTVKIN